MRHVFWDDVMMVCGSTRSGVFLNIILLLVLVNPLLAAKPPGQGKREKQQRLQVHVEERQSEFVKGKSKRKTLGSVQFTNVDIKY